jgi:hypothetical protein
MITEVSFKLQTVRNHLTSINLMLISKKHKAPTIEKIAYDELREENTEILNKVMNLHKKINDLGV